MREENSLAYSTGMRLSGGFHPGWLLFYAVTTAESAERALELLGSEQKRLAVNGLSETEFDAAREGAAFTAARGAESVAAALNSTLLSLHYGRDLNECFRHEAELRNTGREELNALLASYLSNPAAVRVLAGRLPNRKETEK